MGLNAAQTASVEQASEVKQSLVAFALTAPFEKHLRRIARELNQESSDVDDPAVELVERLLFSFKYDDGSSIVLRAT
jgi:hypothetical protein